MMIPLLLLLVPSNPSPFDPDSAPQISDFHPTPATSVHPMITRSQSEQHGTAQRHKIELCQALN